MQFEILLFVQHHHNGDYTLQVASQPSLCAYSSEIEKAREELALILVDRLERSHPRLQSRYHASSEQRLLEFEPPDGLLLIGEKGEEPRPAKISAFLTEDRTWKRLFFPRWDCHYWVSAKEDFEKEVAAFLKNHLLKKVPMHNRLVRRQEQKEWHETLVIEADLPTMEAFHGKYADLDILPAVGEKDEDKDEKDEDKDEAEKETDKKKKKKPTPTLDRIGINLTKLARDNDLEPAFGREKEVEDLLRLIQSPGGKALAIVGPSGIGKTTILNQLVYRLRSPDLPRPLRTRPVFFVDANRLIAGDGWFGDWQRQCLDVIQECIEAQVIWYVGDLLPLLDAGKSVGSDQNISFLLRPYLAGKRLTLIGECTPKRWSQLEIRDIGFSRLFTPYHIEEPPPPQRRQIVQQVATTLRQEQGIAIAPPALDTILDLSHRYSSDTSLLGHSLYFLRRFVSEIASRPDKPTAPLSRLDAIQHFCSETGMPPFLIRDDLPLDPEAIWMTFRSRLIGQEEAIRRMTDLVAMMKSGLSDLGRPLGSFLFVGPTGVGKTETAKALAQYLFGRKDRLLRFDMSEFVTPGSVHRFLGSSEEEGKLTSAIRRNPFCVLLLDEIEKAHPSVFDVLLQVLGEARLTDEAGRTANFRNTVVLMTSNLGVSTFRRGLGFGGETSLLFREHFMKEAEEFFRPEFFNRIDYIVPFMPLEHEAIRQITRREIHKFLEREGIRQRDLDLLFTDPIYEWLAARGVNPRYGARPLKRVIEQKISAPLARYLSSNPAAANQRIGFDEKPDSLAFTSLPSTSKRKDRAAARQSLDALLQKISLLRFRAQRWTQSATYRELVQEVRLFERLSQDKNFWIDRRMAEMRMETIRQGRELLDAYKAFQSQISSLEDLSYEIFYHRKHEEASSIQAELDHSEKLLSSLELQLFGRRFESPHSAVLYLEETRDSLPWIRQLLETYFQIADGRGWRFHLYVSRRFEDRELLEMGIEIPKEDEKDEALKRKLKKRKDKARRQAEDAAEETGGEAETSNLQQAEEIRATDVSASSKAERVRWRWVSVGEWYPDPQRSTIANERLFDQLLNQLFAQSGTSARKALVLDGPFAACLLHAESGLHQRIDGTLSHQARIFFDSKERRDPADLLHPLDLDQRFSEQRKRIFNESRRSAVDPSLDLTFYIQPRYHLLYERFMRAHLYFSTFGAQGLGWFKHSF